MNYAHARIVAETAAALVAADHEVTARLADLSTAYDETPIDAQQGPIMVARQRLTSAEQLLKARVANMMSVLQQFDLEDPA